jgi:hypothetical protein
MKYLHLFPYFTNREPSFMLSWSVFTTPMSSHGSRLPRERNHNVSIEEFSLQSIVEDVIHDLKQRNATTICYVCGAVEYGKGGKRSRVYYRLIRIRQAEENASETTKISLKVLAYLSVKQCFNIDEENKLVQLDDNYGVPCVLGILLRVLLMGV